MGHQVLASQLPGLPPLVGVRLVVIANGLEQAYDRARMLDGLGYRVAACGDPDGAPGFVAELSPEGIVVDLAQDGGAPEDVVRQLRAVCASPLLVIGGGGSLAEMTRVFDAGADDYARPNATTEEVDLRLRAIFRRIRQAAPAGAPAPEPVYQVGDLEIDVAGQVVRKRGAPVALSPTEFRLLVTLAERRGSVIPSRALIARVWGNQYSGETHYLRLYVRYLRQKLEDDPSHPAYIVNRWGAGYALEEPAAAA